MEQYIKKFYENKPKRDCYNGPIPVSFNTQMKTEQIVKEYFGICQRKFDEIENEKRDLHYMKSFRTKLMTQLKDYQNNLNDCIWKTNNAEEAEKCADDFMKKVVSEGYVFAYKLSQDIKTTD